MLHSARMLASAIAVAAAPLAWAQSLPSAQPEQVGMSTQRLQNVAQVFKQEIDQGKLPGAVIMVARDGKLVYSEAVGFQDKEGSSPKPMAKDAIFRIYSMTKPFVSVRP
jgi:CubicO group peptidase (beta-lactamase class C family)